MKSVMAEYGLNRILETGLCPNLKRINPVCPPNLFFEKPYLNLEASLAVEDISPTLKLQNNDC